MNVTHPHEARAIYVDFTGDFHEEPDTLPNGYNITASELFLDEYKEIREHIATQAEVAFSIATGGHSFGDKINAENPFMIIMVGYEGQELPQDILE